MKTKIFIAFIAIASLMSCNSKNKDSHQDEEHEENSPEGVVMLNEKQREALDLKLGVFLMRNLTTVVKTNGQLEVPPSSIAEVTAIVGGNVKEIKVFHGDKVSKGQLLAVLEHPDYIALQEDFSVIANKLEYLEQEYVRQKELFENNVGAGKDYQQAKAEYNTAKARYEGLKARLKLLLISPEKVKEGEISNTINIISPISGYVNEININVGTYVDAKDKLIEITDITTIHADFMIYEKDVHLVKEGQKILFTVSNRPNEELTATVFAIGKEFETNTRAVSIHARLEKNVGNLIPGMYINGRLHTDENYTLTLPNDAIVKEGTKSYIFIQDKEALEEIEYDEHKKSESQEEYNMDDDDNKMAFRMKEVITGQKDDGYTEIHLLDSLADDTQIVMNAAYYLLADMKKEETGDDD
ncbi:cobalt-zinc-cadmium efflux system membrane fusion protein [Ancylomarina subtilis]|uniref:Cobalt-zinc-cadmium efflux system membrane fusion protein n=1 Tax=Ancylomarina subtilis TaxID=1639035 RepID=A0A4Q7V6X5_9BACT|nr:efflux RND transporter periplasmic adaptor subunit [Ancylomarina subtilis]RZT91317.1 cobalt-zinc-cadmium efflux system membrane fusion protein [Ancylomarina subtilis]